VANSEPINLENILNRIEERILGYETEFSTLFSHSSLLLEIAENLERFISFLEENSTLFWRDSFSERFIRFFGKLSLHCSTLPKNAAMLKRVRAPLLKEFEKFPFEWKRKLVHIACTVFDETQK
jgi:hypothetical protein